MAAEAAAQAGAAVVVADHMPSPARKLLIAGRGGLNLTHSEALPVFLKHYATAEAHLARHIRAFPPEALIAWAEGLGQPCFIGSSGRVFPRAMKASPLLRAWMARLSALGVQLRTRHRWLGFAPDGAVRFATPDGETQIKVSATVLALGGASWPRLGSDGTWPALLPGIATRPFAPSNMGFAIAWSDHLRTRFAGTPLKRIALSFGGITQRGEAVLTEAGIEGGAVYALSAAIRDALEQHHNATLHLDLRPDLGLADLAARLAGRRGSLSLSNHLRRNAGLPPVAIALIQEALKAGSEAPDLAGLIKALPLRVTGAFPIARAISSTGGLAWAELDKNLMLRRLPGVFACGEMLDWEAPTGGYLLQACFSTGRAAGLAAARLDVLQT
ncbi:MAG: TIGR03862 family flavoprotein [Roseomonas sp.]|nr:TIGR03862 family flavoprotein [Roseomonas sp.]